MNWRLPGPTDSTPRIKLILPATHRSSTAQPCSICNRQCRRNCNRALSLAAALSSPGTGVAEVWTIYGMALVPSCVQTLNTGICLVRLPCPTVSLPRRWKCWCIFTAHIFRQQIVTRSRGCPTLSLHSAQKRLTSCSQARITKVNSLCLRSD